MCKTADAVRKKGALDDSRHVEINSVMALLRSENDPIRTIISIFLTAAYLTLGIDCQPERYLFRSLI